MPFECKLIFGEKKRDENKPKAKVYVRGFHFANPDARESMVGFRIDSCAIKMGTLMQNGYLNTTRCELTLHMH